ncbi:MAG TPA: DUF4276 family protein [Terriglobia bacterium]|nr:DUF4276 family protein [Terriglobia bacterium]
MVTEIRIYAEGGGDSKDTKAFLREGFSSFLQDLSLMARDKRIRWHVVTCGGRNATFDAFRTALKQHPGAFNVILVDSEAPVQTTPSAHLQQRDGWAFNDVDDNHCHLMTQAMEAWFIADVAALVRFYGQGFRQSIIPKNPDVEQISKDQLEASLKLATHDTQKGEYHKADHAWKILKLIDPAIVRVASHHCERLFTTLKSRMQ